MMSASKVFGPLFDSLSERQREVLTARFGLAGTKGPQTLAAIGDRYGVTRERVRQIEAGALALVAKKVKSSNAHSEILSRTQKYLKSVGGVAKREATLAYHKNFIDGLTENHLALLGEATGVFAVYPEDKHFWDLHYLDKVSLKRASDVIGQFVRFIRPLKSEALGGGYNSIFGRFVRQHKIEAKLARNYLGISKKIHVSPFGETGLAEWPEIKPRTIRDRIYLVLKKKKDPVHFRHIATLINESGLGGRKALAPTVHNELIKDPRFVLVGRGIYGLAEHGYTVGTAKEVIAKILKKEGPMTFEKLVSAVQKDRFFKPNTILANLQNRDFFERLNDKSYRVRES
jgi:hypothetical protein